MTALHSLLEEEVLWCDVCVWINKLIGVKGGAEE